jgi:hypothetical protein
VCVANRVHKLTGLQPADLQGASSTTIQKLGVSELA